MKIVRLNNGEMILGEVTEDGDKITIENPLHIVITDEYKFVNILKPISDDKSITFQKTEVFCQINPNEKVVNYHLLTFSEKSNVVTPKKKKLIV